jgi:Flp pilus assembly CpaF family ATPase
MEQLVEAETIPAVVAAKLAEAIRDRKTILIAGGTGTARRHLPRR